MRHFGSPSDNVAKGNPFLIFFENSTQFFVIFAFFTSSPQFLRLFLLRSENQSRFCENRQRRKTQLFFLFSRKKNFIRFVVIFLQAFQQLSHSCIDYCITTKTNRDLLRIGNVAKNETSRCSTSVSIPKPSDFRFRWIAKDSIGFLE